MEHEAVHFEKEHGRIVCVWAHDRVGDTRFLIRSRAVLNAAGSDLDLSKEAFPFMAVRQGQVAGLGGRSPGSVFRGSLPSR